MFDHEIDALLRGLRDLQDERHLNLRGLARILGYSASYLSALFAGKKRPGLRFLRAVLERFPELRQRGR